MLEHGVKGSEIDALLLTHLHSDHIVDLFQLIISSWHQGRLKPQKIFGPLGTKNYVDRLMSLWDPELKQRIAHEKRPSTKALEVEVTEIDNETLMDFKGLTVRSVEVLHQPVKKAFGFIFENWFDTKPLLIIIFFLFGAAAGITNVFRAAKRMQEQED